MLLILSNRNDLTVDYVISRLIERGIPYFRLNAEDLLDANYDIEISNSESECAIAVNGRSLRIAEVETIWFRRQIYPSIDSRVADRERGFAVGEQSI